MDLKRLRRLAAEVDEHQHVAMRAIDDAVSADPVAGADASRGRRSFLRGLGVGGAALTAGAVALTATARAAGAQESTTTGPTTTGGSTTTARSTAPPAPTTTTTLPPKQPTPEDLVLLAYGQSFELAAVQLYELALASDTLSDDLLPVIAAFTSHHQQHAQAYAGLAGKAALNVANQSIVDKFGPAMRRASDQEAVLTVAFGIETAAASTYISALALLEGTNGAAGAANIMPIEARHAVVIGEALGLDLEEYVPALEDPTTALNPADYPIVVR